MVKSSKFGLAKVSLKNQKLARNQKQSVQISIFPELNLTYGNLICSYILTYVMLNMFQYPFAGETLKQVQGDEPSEVTRYYFKAFR